MRPIWLAARRRGRRRLARLNEVHVVGRRAHVDAQRWQQIGRFKVEQRRRGDERLAVGVVLLGDGRLSRRLGPPGVLQEALARPVRARAAPRARRTRRQVAPVRRGGTVRRPGVAENGRGGAVPRELLQPRGGRPVVLEPYRRGQPARQAGAARRVVQAVRKARPLLIQCILLALLLLRGLLLAHPERLV